MRLNDIVQKVNVTEESDGYGGYVTSTSSPPEDVSCIISVKNDELKVKPDGLGYYRSMSIIVEKGALVVGDLIEYNGVTYRVTYTPAHKHSRQEVFIGYEI